MAWWMAIPAVISLVSSFSQSSQQAAAGEQAASWARYNANMGYQVASGNIAARTQLAMLNAQAAQTTAQVQAGAIMGSAGFNAAMVQATTRYNDLLMKEEEDLLWEQMGLDLKLLGQQRAQERGEIIANQAASGTVIGEGSNADVVISQKTQEALDAFVVRHNADVQANKIMNARAQNMWQGEAQVRKITYEGQLGASVALANANTAAMTGLASARIQGAADRQSNWYRLMAGLQASNYTQSNAYQQSSNTLTHGLFSAAGQFASSYYANKVPTSSWGSSGSLLAENTQYDPSYVGYNQPR